MVCRDLISNLIKTMGKWTYTIIGLVFIGASVIYFHSSSTPMLLTKPIDELEFTANQAYTKSENTSFLSKGLENEVASILDYKDSTAAVSWLMDHGLQHSESYGILEQLSFRIQAQDALRLIDLAEAEPLNDHTQALLIKVITTAFKYDYDSELDALVPLDSDMSKIAMYVKQQIASPMGKESFIKSLQLADFTGEPTTEVYSLVNEAMSAHSEWITSEFSISIKLKYAVGSWDDMNNIIQEINTSNNNMSSINASVEKLVQSFLSSQGIDDTNRQTLKNGLLEYYDTHKVNLSSLAYEPEESALELDIDEWTVINPSDYSKTAARNSNIDDVITKERDFYDGLIQHGKMVEQKLTVEFENQPTQQELLKYSLETDDILNTLAVLNYVREESSNVDNPEAYFLAFSSSHELEKKLKGALDQSSTPAHIREDIKWQLNVIHPRTEISD